MYGLKVTITILQKCIGMLWKYLILTCLVVLICLYFASRSFKRTLIRPIQEVTYATQLLANGYYHIRVPESNVEETKALFVSTNDLAHDAFKSLIMSKKFNPTV